MKTAAAQVMMRVRIPVALKNKLTDYCKSRGLIANHLVTQAIREKLEEMTEDAADLKLAVERKNEIAAAREEYRKGDYLTLDAYARKRGLKTK